MRRLPAAIAVLVALSAACAQQPRPATSPAAKPPKRGVHALQADLAASFLHTPAFSNAVWGVVVRSLRTGETLYALNPRTFLMPASNMKVITMAAAAERLGWDYTFQTRVVATGTIAAGVLTGDLIIVGSGDPSLGGRPTDGPAIVESWADQIRAKGITAIEGRVIGDDNTFDDEGLGAGWAWDYLADGYAAPTSALDFSENIVRVTLKPGAAAGDPVGVAVSPDTSDLVVEADAKTVATDGELDVRLSRLPGTRVLRVAGTVPLGRADVMRTASVDNPTVFAANAFRRALIAKGIAVSGEAVDIDALPSPVDRAGAQTLLTYTSPTLAQIGKVMLKVSQNLYADTLLKVLGRPADGGPATAAAGLKAVRDVLAGWGIDPGRYIQVDGSGLSRYNYVTADVLADVLAHVSADPRLDAGFQDGLPLAGVDGTVASRMKDTRAQGNARAKTGSISNARALSGFVTSADGEPLVFSMIVNNFNVPQSAADAIVDRAVVRLAEFRR